jgi:hypothetical protein
VRHPNPPQVFIRAWDWHWQQTYSCILSTNQFYKVVVPLK